ncbi:MAG: hypothetical protein ACTSU2_05895, partial [Promethearchaeota archaeon]
MLKRKQKQTKKTFLLLVLMVSISFIMQSSFGAATLPTDMYEPNDTKDAATDIYAGSSYTDLTLDTDWDYDYYNITLTGGYLYEFDFWNLTDWISIIIYNSTGESVRTVYLDGNETKTISIFANITEEYTIYIFGSATYYAMNISFGISDDFNEDNDDFSSATGVSMGMFYSKRLFDNDYYSITLDSSDTLMVNLTVTEIYSSYSSISAYIYLYNSSQQLLVKEIRGLSENESLCLYYFNNNETSGTFYILIALEFDFNYYEYNLKLSSVVDDSYENNDLRTTATNLNENITYLEAICMDDDWYSQIITNTSQCLYVLLHPYEQVSSITLTITDSNGIVVSQFANISENIGDLAFLANFTVKQPGVYYYHVSSSTEQFEYVLIISQLYTSKPDDVKITVGSTGNGIEWTIFDNYGIIYGDGGYVEIYKDGVLEERTHYDQFISENQTITIILDDLPEGTYIYEIRVIDQFIYTMATDKVIVTVGNGDSINVSSPEDISYVVGATGNSIKWVPNARGSVSTKTYTIYKDGSVESEGDWVPGTAITISVDGLPVGTYNYTIVLVGDELTVQDTVIVTVGNGDSINISSPEDISYVVGATGNSIKWMPNARGSVSTKTYTIYKDGSVESEG